MEIGNKEFRIVEKVFDDGHKEYHAERLLINLFLFKIWRDYVYGSGYASFKYSFSTFDECLNYLVKDVTEKQKEKDNQIIIQLY